MTLAGVEPSVLGQLPPRRHHPAVAADQEYHPQSPAEHHTLKAPSREPSETMFSLDFWGTPTPQSTSLTTKRGHWALPDNSSLGHMFPCTTIPSCSDLAIILSLEMSGIDCCFSFRMHKIRGFTPRALEISDLFAVTAESSIDKLVRLQESMPFASDSITYYSHPLTASLTCMFSVPASRVCCTLFHVDFSLNVRVARLTADFARPAVSVGRRR